MSEWSNDLRARGKARGGTDQEAFRLYEAGRYQEALERMNQVVFERGLSSDAIDMLLGLHYELGHFPALVALGHLGATANPESAKIRSKLAIGLLALGRMKEAWPHYEYRLKLGDGPGVKPPASHRWNGGSLEGKTINLVIEQGLGDMIQFVRYSTLLQAQGATVLLHVREPLRPLMRAHPELGRTVNQGEQVKVHAWEYFLSLPLRCGTTLETIPNPGAYLRPPPDRAPPEPLVRARGAKRIGLAWAGNPDHGRDRHRSMTLEALAPLARLDGCRFFSLQVDERRQDIAKAGLQDRLTDLSPYLNDFADTAAALAEIDLVISVDTSVVHLAGAMGRPTWVLLSKVSDWRWLIGTERSPWYSSVRLFRQPQAGDWTPVVEAVVNCLKEEGVGDGLPAAG